MKFSVDDLYTRLPAPAQNLALSAKCLQLRRLRYGKGFSEYLSFLRQSEWWSAGDLRAYQNQQLRQMVRHAFDTVPFYQRVACERNLRADDIQTQEDLALLPVISKKDILHNPQDFLSQTYRPRQLVQIKTSGTTGQALRVFLTPEALRRQYAVWWRHRARFGLHRGDRSLHFGSNMLVPAGQTKIPLWRTGSPLRQTWLSPFHLTESSMPLVLEWMNTQQFDFFSGFPSALYVFARFLLENDLRLTSRPKYVVTGSDALLPQFERTLRAVFGVPVTEQYGQNEACGNFARCEAGRFHLDAEFGIVELLPLSETFADEFTGISGEDSPVRRLVFTGLCNPAMPLLRYDVGDLGRVAKGACACGRESLTLEAIDGRVEEYIKTPDGRKVTGLCSVFECIQGAREIQVVQTTRDRIEVRVVASPEYSPREEDILRRELGKRLGPTIRIDFREVDTIARTARGKFRAVISQLEPEEDEQVLRQARRDGVLAP